MGSLTWRLLKAWRVGAIGVLLGLLVGCSTAPPAGIQPVTPFSLERYSGTWYEIARMDHPFERGLRDIRASYRALDDGHIDVLNWGVETDTGRLREAQGRAVFIGPSTIGSLKVSFFGPFYGAYHIAALDQQNYQWALVVGPDRDYFWILSREPVIPAALRDELLIKTRRLGIDPAALIFTEQQGKTSAP